ncbi:MAG: NRDE family protein [Myxococcota bacterium]|nr:NRDE family protein [Myxococcota bacterium]
MCTLIALFRCVPDVDLWLAANRDEYLERPAEGPALRGLGGESIVSPLDLRAGGSWWGLNQVGVFSALTNRPTRQPDPSRRSRGQLVHDTLAAGSAREAAGAVAALAPDAYNPFNLFLADADEAFAVVCDAGVRVEPLEPGVHVIGNVDPNAREVGKIRRTMDRARRVADGPSAEIEAGLAQLCRAHEEGPDPLASTCVHTGRGYGTRSSTLLRLGPAGDLLRHSDGPPCTHEYQDFTPLLSELDLAGGHRSGGAFARKAS